MEREEVLSQEEAWLMNEWVDLLNRSVEKIDPEARIWLIEHGTAKKEHSNSVVFLEIKDKLAIGQPLTLSCGPGGLTTRVEDEHGRTFSYFGKTKLEKLDKVKKGWGVFFIDSNNKALVISDRATFELYEDAQLAFDVLLGR